MKRNLEYDVNSRIEFAISDEFSSNGKVVCIHDDRVLVLDDVDKDVVTVHTSDVLTVLNL